MLRSDSFGALLTLFAEQEATDVGDNTAAGNRGLRNQLVQVLIVRDGQKDMTRLDRLLFLLRSSLASQIANLTAQVLEDGRGVDARSGADLVAVAPRPEHAVASAHGEGQTCLDALGARGLPLLLGCPVDGFGAWHR